MVVLLRLRVTCIAATVALAGLAPEADAAGARARLSRDLVERLSTGDLADTDVILTGTQARVDALAARHRLTLRKRLKSGAAVTVPAGGLEALASDPEVDQLSGDQPVRSSMAVT